MNIIITGTSSGIGLEFVKKSLAKGYNVLATARNITKSPLGGIESPHLIKLELDLLRSDAEAAILERAKEWKHVDLIINNAGIYEDDSSIEKFEKSLLINSIKPLFITKALLPLLKQSKSPQTVQVSSMMGSIEDNLSGGSYSYRASKTALNMLFKSLAVDESWLKVIQIHPGWVQTKLGGESAPLSIEKSVEGMWEVIQKTTLEDSGKFYDYLGQKIPW